MKAARPWNFDKKRVVFSPPYKAKFSFGSIKEGKGQRRDVVAQFCPCRLVWPARTEYTL
jgi:hypothetical protein